jgi:hypothetical protein
VNIDSRIQNHDDAGLGRGAEELAEAGQRDGFGQKFFGARHAPTSWPNLMFIAAFYWDVQLKNCSCGLALGVLLASCLRGFVVK